MKCPVCGDQRVVKLSPVKREVWARCERGHVFKSPDLEPDDAEELTLP
jgi:hypothetical protein